MHLSDLLLMGGAAALLLGNVLVSRNTSGSNSSIEESVMVVLMICGGEMFCLICGKFCRLILTMIQANFLTDAMLTLIVVSLFLICG